MRENGCSYASARGGFVAKLVVEARAEQRSASTDMAHTRSLLVTTGEAYDLRHSLRISALEQELGDLKTSNTVLE